MPDILSIGTSALLSLQQAINTTGHNIANVNTDGYSRQRVDFDARTPQQTGGGFIGNGVTITTVTRSYDQFLTDDVRQRTSSSIGFETFGDLSSRIDNLLADPSVGLGPAIEGFFNAVQDVANNPGSLPERDVLIGEGQVLADRFQYLDDRLTDLNGEINLRIETGVRDINALAASIAELNEQVVRAEAGSGQPPNDLLDARDQAINRLSEVIGVTTLEQDDGAINVLIGSGQALVVGFSATELQTFTDPLDATRTNVAIAGVASQSDISRFLSGGELGAVLDFRSSALDETRSSLGLLATSIADTFNAQQRLGLDLNGQPGLDFFGAAPPTVVASNNNAGTATVAAVISDPGALTGDEYDLSFNGTDFTIRNTTTGASQTGPGPVITFEGVELTVSGASANGDVYRISPVAEGANLFEVILPNAEAFAAASPLRSSSSTGNAGNAELSELSVSDVSGLPLAGDVTLTYDSGSGGYLVSGIAGGPIAYDPATDAGGITAVLGGFSFTLSGTPADGDTLIIQNNTNGTGDNRNALALAQLQSEPILNNGTASYQDSYASIVAGVAIQSRQASAAADTEAALLSQAVAARDGAQGVNLDEEAADLLRYQQAYQAAAQVIAIADELFQTLLAATRR